MVKVLRSQMSGVSVVISEVQCLLAYTDAVCQYACMQTVWDFFCLCS